LLSQRRSLEMIAGGARLSDIPTDICHAIDGQWHRATALLALYPGVHGPRTGGLPLAFVRRPR
jgi:hypothetical protein